MNNLKPFDLEKALAGAKVVTANGHEVKELTYFKTCKQNYPIRGVVNGDIYLFNTAGVEINSCTDNGLCLFLAPELKTGFLTIYPNNRVSLYNTEDEAKHYSSSDIITTKKIEWYE